MKTIIIKCETYYDWLEARAILGDMRVDYTICMEQDEETGNRIGDWFVVFHISYIRWLFVKRGLRRDIDGGSRYKILETY